MAHHLPVEQIAEDYTSGVTIAELARVHGVSEATITRRLRALGIRRHPSAPVQRVQVTADDIAAEYEAGASLVQLAAKYGVSRGTIARRIKAQGVSLRERLVDAPDVPRFPHGFQWVTRGLVKVAVPLPPPEDGEAVKPVVEREFAPASKLPECPTCKTPAGRRCVALKSGRLMSNPHQSRIRPGGPMCRGCGGEPRSPRAHYCEPCHQAARNETYRRYTSTRRRAA